LPGIFFPKSGVERPLFLLFLRPGWCFCFFQLGGSSRFPCLQTFPRPWVDSSLIKVFFLPLGNHPLHFFVGSFTSAPFDSAICPTFRGAVVSVLVGVFFFPFLALVLTSFQVSTFFFFFFFSRTSGTVFTQYIIPFTILIFCCCSFMVLSLEKTRNARENWRRIVPSPPPYYTQQGNSLPMPPTKPKRRLH